jgi:hypothetical protein
MSINFNVGKNKCLQIMTRILDPKRRNIQLQFVNLFYVQCQMMSIAISTLLYFCRIIDDFRNRTTMPNIVGRLHVISGSGTI